MRLLIDGDVIAYRSALRAQKTYWVGKYEGKSYDFGLTSKKEILNRIQMSLGSKMHPVQLKDISWSERVVEEDPANACHTAKLMLNKIVEDLSPKGLSIYLTSRDKSNFRFEDATILPYKGQRKGAPVHLDVVREYLINYWQAEDVFGMEADDKLMMEHHKDLDGTIIGTIDKDLKNAAKWLYNFDTGEVLQLSKRDNLQHFWFQMLRGDSCDNIPGLRTWMTPRKAGEKAVGKLLEDLTHHEEDYYKKVSKFYKANLLEEEDTKDRHVKMIERMNEIGNLLWIRRWEDDKWEVNNEWMVKL